MCSKFMNVHMLYFVLFSNKRVAHILTPVIYYAFLNFEYNKSDKNHVVSQMAHAKNIGEPFMAHAKIYITYPEYGYQSHSFQTLESLDLSLHQIWVKCCDQGIDRCY